LKIYETEIKRVKGEKGIKEDNNYTSENNQYVSSPTTSKNNNHSPLYIPYGYKLY
tara:strand:- start:588 stop:752 length:165 start_codon:yes stop_codon:yes gene_type:complete